MAKDYDPTPDVGVMVWPLFKLFLDSDHTLTTLAAKVGVSRRRIRNAFWRPADQGMRLYGAIAYELMPKGYRIGFETRPREDYSHLFSRSHSPDDRAPMRGTLTVQDTDNPPQTPAGGREP